MVKARAGQPQRQRAVQDQQQLLLRRLLSVLRKHPEATSSITYPLPQARDITVGQRVGGQSPAAATLPARAVPRG